MVNGFLFFKICGKLKVIWLINLCIFNLSLKYVEKKVC